MQPGNRNHVESLITHLSLAAFFSNMLKELETGS
jgi:hypothetical protein